MISADVLKVDNVGGWARFPAFLEFNADTKRNIFGVDEMSEDRIKVYAGKVAKKVAERL